MWGWWDWLDQRQVVEGEERLINIPHFLFKYFASNCRLFWILIHFSEYEKKTQGWWDWLDLRQVVEGEERLINTIRDKRATHQTNYWPLPACWCNYRDNTKIMQSWWNGNNEKVDPFFHRPLFQHVQELIGLACVPSDFDLRQLRPVFVWTFEKGWA